MCNLAVALAIFESSPSIDDALDFFQRHWLVEHGTGTAVYPQVFLLVFASLHMIQSRRGVYSTSRRLSKRDLINFGSRTPPPYLRRKFRE